MKDLRKFMFENVYLKPNAKGEEDKAVHMIKQLFEYYAEHTEVLPRIFKYTFSNINFRRSFIARSVSEDILIPADPYCS